MTVQATQLREDYTGNGTTAVYSYGWRIFSASDIRVVKVTTDGNEMELDLDADYSVQGVGTKNGGTITLTSGNLEADEKLVILSNAAFEQQTDFRNQGAFYPETHEDQFDRLTLMAKQNAGGVSRSLRIPVSVRPNEFNTTLPSDIKDKPRRAILVNEDGDGFDFTPKELTYDEWLDQSVAAANSAQNARDTALSYRDEAGSFRNEALQYRNSAESAESQTLTYRNSTQGFRDESEEFKNEARDAASILTDVLDDALASGLNLPLDMGFTDEAVPPANIIDLGEA